MTKQNRVSKVDKALFSFFHFHLSIEAIKQLKNCHTFTNTNLTRMSCDSVMVTLYRLKAEAKNVVLNLTFLVDSSRVNRFGEDWNTTAVCRLDNHSPN